MTRDLSIRAGRPAPIGATFDGDGVNFAIFSEHASRMTLCLFSPDGKTETARIDLPERDGDVWFGYVPGLRPGQLYGYRANGPYRPDQGHRFNPNKLLIDPYAKRLTGHPVWSEELMGYEIGRNRDDLSFDSRDSAPFMPKCIVTDPAFSWGEDMPPATPMAETIIYEAHVKGMTQLHPTATPRGTFLGLASEPMLDYLTKLGITAIELLPAQAFLDDQFLVERELTNYWGYQSIGFFAPEPRYLHEGQIAEFQTMVARFHAAGIEVLMDVVYNHTGEGNELGPTLCFRGLDNRSYYRLAANPRHYINDTGTGNTLNLDHPMVLRMVMDSLRYWVEVMHVDGFRFDLCSTLGRTDAGFDRGASFFDAVRQDPVLTQVKLIAEPWDIGPGGYQLGAFPPPFAEWNDRFRDGVRQFWRGDPGRAPDLADRLTGSALQFDHSGRPATSSVNFVSAHDGFTLADVVAYNSKHNEANGEDNRDGHSENYSFNMGAEGDTDDAGILSARARRRRNMMATLLLAQGTPMILAGDEIGHSQKGNNNAYCQDNELTWIDWANGDDKMLAFTSRMIAFRKARSVLRQKLFLHARERAIDGKEDLFWWRADGTAMTSGDWENPELRLVCAELRTASDAPAYAVRDYAIFAVFNAGPAVEIVLPEAPAKHRWRLHVDTDRPDAKPRQIRSKTLAIAEQSVVVMILEKAG
ncbi:glycogen debranching protein GlgX [Oricola sp.]|uniref:glycogen debranching protein GlgX n=1 Tax=Oricola sp. TaxID=1979950 RepID=UPI0025F8D37D|nr:glycogen debranching protein GlgX [Oricola sp.]MCI5077973.1 glycogen debranching protein GlgX [Oricola sp.]